MTRTNGRLSFGCEHHYHSVFFHACRLADPLLSMTWSDARRERTSGASATMRILSSATATLTSLCFDWVITNKFHGYPEAWTKTLIQLFSLRFPRLRTFQLRNATREMTQLPGGIFLLSRCTYGNLHKLKQKKSNAGMMCLEFMEAHPRLRCLAWPISQFFSNEPMSAELDRRVQAVVKKLGENLVELRVDEITGVDEGREEFSHADNLVGNVKRNQRRRFVEQFAPQMRELECFTMKGDIPRDERRELMRALHQCSLKKISVVGISWPPGNTWGPGSRDTRDPQAQLLGMSLAGEHHPSTYALGAMQELKPVGSDFSFEPSYGWHESPPLLRTLATFHASTVTELNFSGKAHKRRRELVDGTNTRLAQVSEARRGCMCPRASRTRFWRHSDTSTSCKTSRCPSGCRRTTSGRRTTRKWWTTGRPWRRRSRSRWSRTSRPRAGSMSCAPSTTRARWPGR